MGDSRITRNRENIESWADEHDRVPIRDGDQIRLIRESELTADQERLDWDTFHQEVDADDHVVTYHGDTEDRDPFEVGHRDDVLDRVTSESDDLTRDEAEQRLIEGETITGTITETTVIEETIVEKTTIESEVVDREITEQSVVDVQLVDRECQSCNITAENADFDYADMGGTDRFLMDDTETGSITQYDEYPFDVSVDVREDWMVTIDQHERYTVETDITDVDVSETEQIEAQDLETRIDVDAIHQQLIDSGVIDIDADMREGEFVDTETYDIESEFTEDDILTTYLTSHRQLQREISDRTRLTTEVVEGELLDREIVSESAIDTDLSGHEMDGADAREFRVLPEESDEGKPVINASGDKLGEVADVNEGVAYVDPHPSLTKKILARLGAEEDDEYYQLRRDKIDHITDDEVVVSTGELDDELDEDNR